jgi:hypothetical protein
MGKFLVRLTIVGVAIYFLISFVVAQFCGTNIFSNFYIVLFELIAVVYCYSEGKYHCRFLKYTALSIFIGDTITRLDFIFDFLTTPLLNLIPIILVVCGGTTSLIKAIRHFHKVNKLKRQRNEYKRTIAHKENGISSS